MSNELLLFVGGKWFVLVICMASFEGESASLVEFGTWFDLPWFQEEHDFLPLRNLKFWLLPS
jgi:hypothetical protein